PTPNPSHSQPTPSPSQPTPSPSQPTPSPSQEGRGRQEERGMSEEVGAGVLSLNFSAIIILRY
ncbi:hypothetical protein, partial [Okeania sp. SIO3B5]|uniref:hypothetical protein n=1 Tax=Okeania sp. SIO3B5 TaxID=2607811 RepID=UPI0025FC5C97